MRTLLLAGALCAACCCAPVSTQAAGTFGPRIGGVQLGQTIQEAQNALQGWNNAALAVEGPGADGSAPSIHVSLKEDDLCANLFFNAKGRLENFACWGSCLRALSKKSGKAENVVQGMRSAFALPELPHTHLPSDQGQPPEDVWQHENASQHWNLTFRMDEGDDENLMMSLQKR